jgi:hypothetical protein
MFSGTILICCIVVAGLSLGFADSPNPNSRQPANIASTTLELRTQPMIIMGFLDKLKTSDLGASDCFDIWVLNDDAEVIVMGIITDNQDYKDFYDDVWYLIFPEDNIIKVEEDDFNIWNEDTDIYAELKVPVTFNEGGPNEFVLPPFTIKFNSIDQPSKTSTAAGPFPSGWSYTRDTRKAYDAISTFYCQEWGVSLGFKSLGETQFNTVDTFIPPSPP